MAYQIMTESKKLVELIGENSMVKQLIPAHFREQFSFMGKNWSKWFVVKDRNYDILLSYFYIYCKGAVYIKLDCGETSLSELKYSCFICCYMCKP